MFIRTIKLAVRVVINVWTFVLLMLGMFIAGMWMSYGPNGYAWIHRSAAEQQQIQAAAAALRNPIIVSRAAGYAVAESGSPILGGLIAGFLPVIMIGLAALIIYAGIKLHAWAHR